MVYIREYPPPPDLAGTYQEEAYRFEDEDDYEDKNWFNNFIRLIQKWAPQKPAYNFISPERLSRLFLLKDL